MKKLCTLLLLFIAGMLTAAGQATRTDGSTTERADPTEYDKNQEIKSEQFERKAGGERPPVDWRTVSDNTIEPEVFLVKFEPSQAKTLEKYAFTKDEKGYLKTGIGDFDLLSKHFQVTDGRPMLSRLYDIPGKHHDYKERHKAWGFHLWYEFAAEHKGDMIQLIEAFKKLESVAEAEPRLKIRRIEPVDQQPVPKDGTQNNSKWTPNDPSYNLQWNLENTGQVVAGMPGTHGADVSVKRAWDISKGSPNVVVAVFDSGIKYNHEDLAGNMWPDIGPDGNETNPGGHGTSVAGIISAVSNNAIGIAGIAGGSGFNDGARLMSLDIFDGSHGMNNLELNIYAADNGAAISQNSWGYIDPNVYNTDDLYGIDYFNANGGGEVMDGGITFFASGNDGDDLNWYPGYYSGAVAVAATDNNDTKAYFSSYGDYVELSAPGLNVSSTGIATDGSDGYFYNSGTSFSAPHASGVAALMLSMAPGKLSPQQLREIMKATADDIDYLNPNFAGQMGNGRVNALAALQGVQDMLDGLENPQALNAITEGPTQINLNLAKNDHDHNVMVVYTTDNTFGTPVGGTVYSPGDNIPGGGTVIYRGSANTVSHTALEPNTVYYYKAYSYNNSNHYSSGKKANARTEPSATADDYTIINESETYSDGDIPTDFPFNPSGVSSCPGSLTVTISTGAVITGVDVAYEMTAFSPAFRSHQRSRLVCTSSGGKYEANIYSGTGDAGGVQAYSRTGLDIANEVTGGGNITFELHALRTWQGEGNCNTTYNRVDNNTWTVTVHYYLPLPAIHYTPFAATTSATGNRSLDDVHISTSHPDGIAGDGNAPRIYWRVNAGTWQSVEASSVNGNLYDFVIGTSGLSNDDEVEYFVIAQSVSGDVAAEPGAGLDATDVNTITTYPTNPHSYSVTSGPLAGDYSVSATKFNQLSGRNITFEKVTTTVLKEVWVADEPAAAEETATAAYSRGEAPELAEQVAEVSHRANGRYEWSEVEEITYVPMENGKVYNGPLYIENTDKSKDIKGTYATLTAAIDDLNSRGVSNAVNFLLTETSYSAGETFPLEINITSEHKPSANNPVTIKPDAGSTATISGAVDNDAIFRIIDTDYVTIDGSNSGGSDRSLTIENTSTTAPQVVLIGSTGTTPVVGSSVKNCIINNGAQTSSAVVVTAADGSAGSFNDITIQNNSISRAYIGVYALAAVNPGNGSGLLVADNDLDASGTNSIRLIGIYVQGVDGASVSGNTVSNISNTLAEAIRGIWFATGTNGTIFGNTVSNLTKTVTSADATITGIYITSGAATKNVSVTGNTISGLTNTGTLAGFAGVLNLAPNVNIADNTIQTLTQNTNEASIWGIVTAGASNVVIAGNGVSAITTATTGTPNGINIQGNSTTVKVFNNRISDIKNTNADGYRSVGLALSSTSTVANVLVYNNFIWDVTGGGRNSTTDRNGYGIRITDGGGYRLYHNSVHLATNQTASNGIPACMMIDSGLGDNSLDIQNNIFSMAATVGDNRCAVISNSASTVFSTIDYNDYYSSGANLGRIDGTYRTTIADWRTGTGQDANSIDDDPNFVSDTDLHIDDGFASPLAGTGIYLNAVIDDIDGDLRSDPPFIGADEFGRSWTGATSSAWDNDGNWNPDAPTAAAEAVRIPAGVTNYPEITGAATCGYLMIDEGAEVTIAPGGSLTVSERLTNNAGNDRLVIQSDAMGTGSLIHNNFGVDATVQRFVTGGWETWDAGWHLISSPVTAQPIAAFTSTGVGNDYDFYGWDEPAQIWKNYKAPGFSDWNNGTNFNPGQGYLISYEAETSTRSFSGTLKISNVWKTQLTQSGDEYSGWNLLGNPFASALEWNTGGDWELSNIAGTAKIWHEGNKSYSDINSAGIIPSAQGFMVQVTESSGGSLVIPASKRVHHEQSWYKRNDTTKIQLMAVGHDNHSAQESNILVVPESTEAFHSFHDSRFLAGYAPVFYSIKDEVQLSSYTLPAISDDLVIPFGFEKNDGTSFCIELTKTIPGIALYLLDLKLDQEHKLTMDNPYAFESTEGDNPLRFELHFSETDGTTDIVDTEDDISGKIWYHANRLYVKSIDDATIIYLYDINGRPLRHYQPGVGEHSYRINLPAGVYIVRMQTRTMQGSLRIVVE